MRIRALPLVAGMWIITGGGIAAAVFGPQAYAQPSATPGHVVMLQTLWMSVLVCAAVLRYGFAPSEIETARRNVGAESALERAESFQDSIWYLLGLAPLVVLMGLALTGWAFGAAVMWVASFACTLAIAPRRSALERLATGGR